MSVQSEQFPFTTMDPARGEASRLPYLPITLEFQGKSQVVSALVDSGSTVNVLPYDVGLKLGADWEQLPLIVHLTGNLAHEPARVLTVLATVGKFSAVRLAFAWTKSNVTPVILGQVNFFMEFDVCFHRSRSLFDVKSVRA